MLLLLHECKQRLGLVELRSSSPVAMLISELALKAALERADAIALEALAFAAANALATLDWAEARAFEALT